MQIQTSPKVRVVSPDLRPPAHGLTLPAPRLGQRVLSPALRAEARKLKIPALGDASLPGWPLGGDDLHAEDLFRNGLLDPLHHLLEQVEGLELEIKE